MNNFIKEPLKRMVYKFATKRLQHKLKKIYFLYEFRINFKRSFCNAEKEMKILDRFVKRNGTVLDIGANVGYYTVIFSEIVGPNGTVHSFEPVPENFDILQSNIRQLGLTNTKVYNMALMDKEGPIEMVIPRDHHGLENYYQAHLVSTATHDHSVKVEASSVDGLGKQVLGQVDFVKCDVEGAEYFVLQGAKGLLTADKPSILCEIAGGSTSFGVTSAQVFDFLYALGYKSYYFTGTDLVPCTGPSGSINYFFIHRERQLATFS